MSNQTAFAPGTHVIVSDKFGPYLGTSDVKAGTTLVVTGCRETLSGGYQARVAHLAEFTDFGATIEVGEFGTDWFSPVPRKVIPFALTKDTSRQYALRSNSRMLSPEQRKVLDKAAKGEEVDVWNFHLAVTAALSLAATRAGQSKARREYTKMARHLLYISGAVVANSLAGLPPVQPGQRSPKIAEQEREIEDLRATVKRLAEDAQRTQFALEEEQARVGALIEEKTDLELHVDRLARGNSRKTAQMDYALSLMAEPEKFKVIGYGDALNSVEA